MRGVDDVGEVQTVLFVIIAEDVNHKQIAVRGRITTTTSLYSSKTYKQDVFEKRIWMIIIRFSHARHQVGKEVLDPYEGVPDDAGVYMVATVYGTAGPSKYDSGTATTTGYGRNTWPLRNATRQRKG